MSKEARPGHRGCSPMMLAPCSPYIGQNDCSKAHKGEQRYVVQGRGEAIVLWMVWCDEKVEQEHGHNLCAG